jgi:hypothetical protein
MDGASLSGVDREALYRTLESLVPGTEEHRALSELRSLVYAMDEGLIVEHHLPDGKYAYYSTQSV